MKKLFYFLSTSLVLSLTSCSEDDSNNISDTSYLFSTTQSSLPVSNVGESFVEVQVGVTTKSSVDRPITLSVASTSTATANQYTIDQSSLVIRAGEYSTKVKITGNYANLPATGNVNLVLDLVSDEQVMPSKGTHTISLYRFCATDLAGQYSVTTTYQVHDFLPNYSSNTMTATVTAQTATNTYKVDDFSGGLYSTGPYATSYGTGAASQANNRDLIFTVNCGEISWSGQNDPWGAIVPLSTGVNSYNPTTGVITISWHCLGYGEKGVSVYTPL